jgi:hypothetical protein
MTELIEFGGKSGLIALSGIGLAALMTRFRPGFRHAVVLASLLLCLIVPVASQFGPRTYVPVPSISLPVAEPLTPGASAAGPTIEAAPLHRRPADPIQKGVPVGFFYLLGALAVAIRFGIGCVRLRTIAGRSRPVSETMEHLIATLDGGFGARVAIARRGDIPCALTAGIFRPIVFLPEESASWSPERLAMVLRHELAHVQRRDADSQLLAESVVALYWFNPVIWFGARAMRGYAELAADEAVLRSGIRPSDYAQDLLSIARQMGIGARWATGPELLLMKNQRIENRLKSILSPAARLRGLTTLQSVGMLSGAILVAFGISTMRASAGGPSAETRKLGEVEVSLSRVKQLGLATMMYASEHDALPPAKTTAEARQFVESFVDDKDCFLSGTKGVTIEFNTKLAGVPLANLQSPAETIEWYEKVPSSKMPYVVVYVDGHAVRYQGKSQPEVAQRLSVRLKAATSASATTVGLGKGH